MMRVMGLGIDTQNLRFSALSASPPMHTHTPKSWLTYGAWLLGQIFRISPPAFWCRRPCQLHNRLLDCIFRRSK